MADGLYAFGSLETVEIPSSGPGAANDAVAKAPVGILYRHQGNTYRYVQHNPGTAVATAAGGVAYWRTLSPTAGTFVVSSDESDTIAGINGVAGVYGGVVTALYYTWIQVAGVVAALVVNSTVAGDKMIGYATDLNFNRIAAGGNVTDQVFGIALSTKNTTTGTSLVLLQNLNW